MRHQQEDNEAAVRALTEERDNALQELNSANRKLARMEEALNIKEEETERLCNLYFLILLAFKHY